jgi:peptide-methionine (S)-S-oxide reductase
MPASYRVAPIALAALIAFSGVAAAQQTKSSNDEPSTEKSKEKAKPKSELATFGGGCFWCQEAVFERIPGVKSVVSGYSGGSVPNPTYQLVCAGVTGHAEVVQIEFDPEVVSFDKLLKIFWVAHDPTTLNQQGPDYGTQYRSVVLYHSEAQKKATVESIKELKAHKTYRRSIVTQVVPFEAFYPAEEYHQDYYRNHRFDDYSQSYIAPKVKKVTQKLKAETQKDK